MLISEELRGLMPSSLLTAEEVSKAALKRARMEEIREIVEIEGEAKSRAFIRRGCGGGRGRETGGDTRGTRDSRW